jgi:hypothetical protein
MKFRKLSDLDIKKSLKNNTEFRGVYMKDELPNKLKKGFYVLNLDTSDHCGTHWTVFYKSDKDVLSFYFDSVNSNNDHKLIYLKYTIYFN